MPDVEWHPVSETPRYGRKWICFVDADGERKSDIAEPRYLDSRKGVYGWWWDSHHDSGPIEGVTHWADITYPPAPEVE